MKLPRLYRDDEDAIVVDVDNPHRLTRRYDNTLRTPAPSLRERFPIMRGFLLGAPVDRIADGLSSGERWLIGPAPMSGKNAIWLLELERPYSEQIAAWRSGRTLPEI